MNNHNYIVIMAGGKGTRLWPMSRDKKPKQLQKLIGHTTMIQDTFARASKIVPTKNIYISTNSVYQKEIKRQLPKLPQKNFIIEPIAKNTAPAIGLIAATIAKRDPKAIITTIASDHAVEKTKNFISSIKACQETVKKNINMIGTIGIVPNCAHTGFGYIERGKELTKIKKLNIYHVKKFVEKPDKKTAQKYVKSGNFYWNASYFTFNVKIILKYFKKYEPLIYKSINKIYKDIDTKNMSATISKEFKRIKELAFDYLIEKLSTVFIVPADLGWDDIGSWEAIKNILSKNKKQENIVRGNHIGIDNQDSLIYAQDKLICTIGLNNLVVVDTKDVLFISNKSYSQDVKKLIDILKSDKKYHKYL